MAIRISKDMKKAAVDLTHAAGIVSGNEADNFQTLLSQEQTKLREKESKQHVFQDFHTNEATMMTAMYESMAKRIRTDQIMKQDSYLRVSKI
ncbi:hypothetical protein SAMN02910358_02305 [Lachnospiraceae bacterium XBB1006]|nr:hypothetical protein SAMN02910358_02305 [Lachnospiraceae bacterium XBB1006]